MTKDEMKRKWAHLTPNCMPDQYPTIWETMALLAYLKAFDMHWGWGVFFGFLLVWKALQAYGHRRHGQSMDIFESIRKPAAEEKS